MLCFCCSVRAHGVCPSTDGDQGGQVPTVAGVAVSHSPLLLGTLTQLQRAEFPPQDCESPPGTLSGMVWGCRREGGALVPASPLGCVLRSSHALIQPLYCPNVSSASPLQPLIPGACAWAGIGDAAISIPWERFDQGRMCWSLVVTEQLGPAHLSREGGNINPII